MEQRYCIKFLHLMGCTTNEIINRLQEWYGEASLHKTQDYFWVAELNSGRTELNDAPFSGRPKVSYIDPFSSIRQIAAMFGSSGATVFRRLTEMGYKSYFLRWITHKLDDSDKKLRVSIAKIMLQRLEVLKHDHFQYIITGDELCFRFYYDHKRKWISMKSMKELNRPIMIKN